MDAVAASKEFVLDPVERRFCQICLLPLLARYAKRMVALLLAISALPWAVFIVLTLVLSLTAPWAKGAGWLFVAFLGLGIFFAGGYFWADFLDRFTGRLSEGAGTFWVVLGIIGTLGFAVISLRQLLNPTSPGFGIEPVSPAVAVPVILFSCYVYTVMLRAAFGVLLATEDERRLMRETMPAAAGRRRALIRIWGLPPNYAYARKSRWQYVRLMSLALANSAAFGLATLMILMLAGVYAFGQIAVLVTIALFFLFIGLGALTRGIVERKASIALVDLQRHDKRAPILFLRAFVDDQIPLAASRVPLYMKLIQLGQMRANLDRVLLEEGTPYGPVVALGKPGDKFPPYGAARGYFSLEHWQGAVADLARDAAAVVICVDDTEGIWWEIEHLVANRHLAKTLILLHPKRTAQPENAPLLGELARRLHLPAAARESLTAAAVPKRGAARVIGFYRDASGAVRIFRASRTSHFAYLLALRHFLRDRFGSEPVQETLLKAAA
jgi:hypothetical protein